MSSADTNSDQTTPTRKRRKGIAWRRDLVILARLPHVERMHLAGKPNTAIAEELRVDEGTIRADLKRLSELWQERVQDSAELLRARAVAELMDVKNRALAAAEFDEMCERAVLFDEPNPDGRRVERDEKGSVMFRGNKSAALTVARQAVMDAAKLLGIVIEKQEHSGEMLVRQYVGVDPDKV